MGQKRPSSGVEEEEAFVRGGGSGLAPVEKKRLELEAYAEAAADLDAAAAAGKKGGKRRKAAGAAGEPGDEEDTFFASLSAQGRLPKYVELLKFKSLSPGTKLWGAVIEVMPHELVVSLPHGLRGHVAYAEASDWLAEQSKKADKAEKAAAAAAGEEEEGGSKGGKKRKAAGGVGAGALPPLTDLFAIGQVVRCTVTALRAAGEAGGAAPPAGKKKGAKGGAEKKGKKRVDVSLRLSKLNSGLGLEALREGLALPACVRSVEDHGYLLALGIKGASGFLPQKEAAAAGLSLHPGSLLEVVVAPGGVKPAGAGATSVSVLCGHEAVTGAVAREWEGLNIGSLLPGQLVTARVRNVLSDGLICSFLTYFSGTVDPFHLGADLAADWSKQFSANQRLRARILWVDPATKRVGLTLQRHLLTAGLPPNFPALGQVFEGAIVRRVDEGLGLLCELPSGEAAGGAAAGAPLTPGFAHISNLSEDKVEDMSKRFRPGQRLRARVLGFRPMDGLAVLSIKPSVVDQSILSMADLRPGMPVSGTVSRVEEYGLLLSLTPSIRALVPVLHASDLGSRKGLKKFKEGQRVAGKIMTLDAASKKVTVTLKPSVVGSKFPPITSTQDAVLGGRSHGVVTGATDFGVFVQFFGGVTGLAHISECGLSAGQKPGDAFQPGQVVKCRVLGSDPGRKGLKLSLVTKKKAAGDADVAPAGADVAAEAKRASKAPGGGADADALAALGDFQPGQLVRGSVVVLHNREVDGESVPAYYEVAVTAESGAAAGAAPAVGRLEVAHLADHPAAVAALVEALQPGAQLGTLLVLQRLEGAKQLRLTRKASLLGAAAAGQLPASLEGVAEGAVLAGYVASVTRDAVFVRFMGGLTGRAGLAQLSDTFVSDPHLFFREGQSVRATVVQVERERERFSVALKQSLCGSRDAALLQSLFSDLEAADALGSGESPDVDWSTLAVGSIVPGEVHEVKEFGLLCDLQAHADVVGLVPTQQVPSGAAFEPGTSVQAVVLDVVKREGVLDLSLLPRLQQAAAAAAAAAQEQQQQPKKKKQRKGAAAAAEGPAAAGEQQVQEGQQVEVTIELAKEQQGYCVVSMAGRQQQPILGFLPTTDFNLQHQGVTRQFAAGDTLTATVAALPSAATTGRLLLYTPLTSKPLRAAGGRAAAVPAAGSKAQQGQQQGQHAQQQAVAPPPGSCVEATVGTVHAVHADLLLEGGCHGRLHITEAAPAGTASSLAQLKTGDKVTVAVLGRVQTAEGRRHSQLECSSRAEVLAAAQAQQAQQVQQAQRVTSWGAIKPGQQLPGFVTGVAKGYVWCAFSPSIRGRAYATQASSSIEECEQLKQRFQPGQAVQATVLHVDSKRRSLDVSLLPHATPAAAEAAAAAAAEASTPGALLLGCITSVGGGCVRVQLSARSAGRVALTDIHDAPVQQALAGLEEGQFCRAAVLGPDPASSSKGSKGSKGKGGDGSAQLLLSLRPSAGAQCAAHAAAAQEQQEEGAAGVAEGLLQPGELKPGQKVCGYVKSAGQQGVFVCLARNLDARIRLNHLADGFVEKPAESFPEGRLVAGQVLKVEGDRVDLTLRSRKVAPSLESLEEGQVVRGRVKRLTQYGVFVELEGEATQGATGLAHVSEVADDFVKDLASLFTPGQRVLARVLKVDAAGGKLSLGLKPSYFEGVSDLEADGDEAGAAGKADFDAELEAAGASSDGEEEEGGSGSGSSSEEEEDEEAVDKIMAALQGSSSDDDAEASEGEEKGSGDEEEEDFDLDADLAEAESGSSGDDDDDDE